MPGIGFSTLTQRLTTEDPANARMAATARTTNGTLTGGAVWNPTSRSILGREEIDKQNEDNLTFLFEYRALLNSRVQTVISQLSNALATDLDVAMSAANPVWGGNKPAMNGSSTPSAQDPGAARSTFNFLMGWKTTASDTTSAALTGSPAGIASGYNANFTGTSGAINVFGTATLIQANSGIGDVLNVNFNSATAFIYSNTLNPTYNMLDDNFAGPLGASARTAKAKCLTQKVLFDLVSSVEYRSVLTSGLFKNLVVSASSSLATGAQLQAAITLNYDGSENGGSLVIGFDKFTAFYHS